MFICGHRKSGTTMLLHLLDGHSDILTYPEDLCVLYGYYPHHIKELKTLKQRKERFNSVVFDMLLKKVNKREYADKIDILRFKTLFERRSEGSDYQDIKELLNNLFLAYKDLSDSSGSYLYSAWKETSIEIYASQLNEFYPDCKMIHLVRDPRDNYAAIKSGVENYYSKLGESELDALSSVLHRVSIGFKMAKLNQKIWGNDRYKIIRFEDLVSDSKLVMQELCDFLEVPYKESLLKPTSLSVAQGGNSHDGKKLFSISSGNVGRWSDRITEDEAKVLEFFLSNEMSDFGYDLAFDPVDTVQAVAEFYKWSNYKYHYKDSFGVRG